VAEGGGAIAKSGGRDTAASNASTDATNAAAATSSTRRASDATANNLSSVKEVLDLTFHNSADRTQFLAYIHGAITASDPVLDDVPEALRTVRRKILSPADSVKCSAATLGNKAWGAVEQVWPSAKHDVYVGTFNVRTSFYSMDPPLFAPLRWNLES
jgi:hypothetical protein